MLRSLDTNLKNDKKKDKQTSESKLMASKIQGNQNRLLNI